MSIKRIFETLAGLGLNQSDAKIYVFLAKKGPHTGKDLCNALRMQKPQVYPCLRNLQNKGIVNATAERPAIFSALPFEKVLDRLVQGKIEEAQRTQQEKENVLSAWQSIAKTDMEEEL